MQRVTNRFEPAILDAINHFENEFGESVTWEVSMDFFPDMERATEDNVPLVATIGIYLEMAGATEETIVSGSIFTPTYLEAQQIYQGVFESLVAIREERERSTALSKITDK